MAVEELRAAFEPRPVLLGVGYDLEFSFRPRAGRVAVRASVCFSSPGGPSEEVNGMMPKSLVRAYLFSLPSRGASWTIVRRVGSCLAPSNLDVLTRAQNRALRIITGQCRTTPGSPLHHSTSSVVHRSVREGPTST